MSNLANSESKSIDEPSDYDETNEAQELELDEDDSSDDNEPKDYLTDTETVFQDTANVAANAFTKARDSAEAADPREPAEVLAPTKPLEWNRRRRRNGLPTKDELEVANFLLTKDFRSRWTSTSASDDVLVAVSTIIQLKKDPNHSAPLQKESRPKRIQTRRGRRS